MCFGVRVSHRICVGADSFAADGRDRKADDEDGSMSLEALMQKHKERSRGIKLAKELSQTSQEFIVQIKRIAGFTAVEEELLQVFFCVVLVFFFCLCVVVKTIGVRILCRLHAPCCGLSRRSSKVCVCVCVLSLSLCSLTRLSFAKRIAAHHQPRQHQQHHHHHQQQQ